MLPYNNHMGSVHRYRLIDEISRYLRRDWKSAESPRRKILFDVTRRVCLRAVRHNTTVGRKSQVVIIRFGDDIHTVRAL